MTRSTIATELERQQLCYRVAHMDRIVEALQQRAEHRDWDSGEPPAPLGHAIEGFRSELERLRARLAELDSHAAA